MMRSIRLTRMRGSATAKLAWKIRDHDPKARMEWQQEQVRGEYATLAARLRDLVGWQERFEKRLELYPDTPRPVRELSDVLTAINEVEAELSNMRKWLHDDLKSNK